MNFEVMPFEAPFEAPFDDAELADEFADEFGDEFGAELEAPARAAAPRFVRDFSGPPAECVAALRRAGRTRAQALAIVNAQVALAIRMLRKAAADLKRGRRSAATSALFLRIFRVRPGFVPTWLKTSSNIRDRGDVVRVRCERVADLLASGRIRYFCRITAANCPDCGDNNAPFACSSFGAHRVVCLGQPFWDDMRAGRTNSMLSTLMHEPFHIFFGRVVTEHRATAGKFGGINCIVQFVFEANRRAPPARVTQRCTGMAVRAELEFA